jgi:hypothetical protein
MKLNTIIVVLLLFYLTTYLNALVTDEKEINQIYDDMMNNKQQNKLRRYMIFEIEKSEVNHPEYFSRIVVDFFTSNNFNNGVYNLNNKVFVVYLSKSDDIKIQTIRDYFGKAFKRIYWFNRKNKEHDFRKLVFSYN